MIPEIELEALRCFDRTALEGLQIHSRYLRELVRRHEHSLPLRYISSFTVSASSVKQIQGTDLVFVVASIEGYLMTNLMHIRSKLMSA